ATFSAKPPPPPNPRLAPNTSFDHNSPQPPWWLYQIPYPAISVTACTQAIMVAALEAAIWGVAYVATFEPKSAK
ncbi:nitroreductase family protein, partial [Caballeronia glebae]|uniref:hypothetical protein n=1 Tax=Caballeronia glebae TaxID=1777143 RepID=UPI001F1B7BFA